MFSDPDGFRCFHTARCTLFGGSSCFDLLDVTAVQVGLVFDERDELSPRRILLVPSIVRLFQHSLHVQVLNEYSVVLADEPRCNLVLVVQHLPLDVALHLRHFPALLLVVIRPFFLPRQLTLFTAKTLVLVFEVEPIHCLPVAGVDVVLDAKVNPNAVTCVKRVHVGFLGQIGVVGFEAEGDEPLASPFFLERDFLD